MTTLRTAVAWSWGTALHMLSILGLVGVLVGFTAQPTAAYDWCSSDPVFTFRQGGLVKDQPVDVQLMVPMSALPLSSAATLTVTVPLNVTYHETLKVPMPGFQLQTVFVSSPANPAGSGYPLTFAGLVPGSDQSVPVRLVITDPLRLKVTTVNGYVGTPLSATIQIGP